MKIIVPATSANIGPGFDSCGIAVNRYLTIEVEKASEQWEVAHDLGEDIPIDETNLLITTALRVKGNLTPHKLVMTSDIPLTRGLGSSSSVIVAGIELANQLGKLNLTQEEKLTIATEIEGHPDNVAPAIYGDFVIASFIDGEVSAVHHQFPDCAIIGFIPDEVLSTEKSREVLPKTLDFKEAVAASSIANVMIGAILSDNMQLAGQMIEHDLFHEKYRRKLVPHVEEIRAIGHQQGAYATYLSGAGPTVLVLAPREKAEEIYKNIEQLSFIGVTTTFEIDRVGVKVEN
ncbi:MAG: homoserine kinase [Lactobacillales bacterium]|jgi:homoserine kinase|nr:homoserine kinase [Lactobacillales bacterium]